METPTQEPTQITAGDSVGWVRSIPAYPASEGWILHYVLLSLGKPPITLDSTAAGAGHQIAMAAATTAEWPPADYRWTAYVTKGAERKTLGSGQLRILPDPSTQTETFDPRTENQKILDAITAVLAGELTNPLAEYKIDGLEAKRYGRNDLLKLQGVFKHRVAVENGEFPFIATIPLGLTPGGRYA